MDYKIISVIIASITALLIAIGIFWYFNKKLSNIKYKIVNDKLKGFKDYGEFNYFLVTRKQLEELNG